MSRAWGIRHIRYWIYRQRLARWMRLWSEIGYPVPSEHDLAFLDAVWHGEA